MAQYTGNGIYDYIEEKKLDYFYLMEHNWLLIYGDSASIPKVLVLVSEVENLTNMDSVKERNAANKAFIVSKSLNLPFIFVRFMINSSTVAVWHSFAKIWEKKTYEQLRDLYEQFGVVQPGTAKKAVNIYTSSPYHDWQRNNLGRITVSDIDLVKIDNNQVKAIYELKRSYIDLSKWKPFENDYPNFALIINSIVGSNKQIPFKLYYNKMFKGEAGMRNEDINEIKVFEFSIPNITIGRTEVKYNEVGVFSLSSVLI